MTVPLTVTVRVPLNVVRLVPAGTPVFPECGYPHSANLGIQFVDLVPGGGVVIVGLGVGDIDGVGDVLGDGDVIGDGDVLGDELVVVLGDADGDTVADADGDAVGVGLPVPVGLGTTTGTPLMRHTTVSVTDPSEAIGADAGGSQSNVGSEFTVAATPVPKPSTNATTSSGAHTRALCSWIQVIAVARHCCERVSRRCIVLLRL